MFNPLSDEFDGYDHAVKILSLQDADERGRDADSPRPRKRFGNDPVLIFEGDISISGGIYEYHIYAESALPALNIVSAWYVRKMMRSCAGEDGYIHLALPL